MSNVFDAVFHHDQAVDAHAEAIDAGDAVVDGVDLGAHSVFGLTEHGKVVRLCLWFRAMGTKGLTCEATATPAQAVSR